jgi:hypothetical protein
MAFRKLYDLPQGFNQPTATPTPAYNPNGGGTSSYSGGVYKYTPPVQPRFAATGGTTSAGRNLASDNNILPRIPQSPAKGSGNQNFIPEHRQTTPSSYQPPKVSPFLWNMFGSMKTMDVDQRTDYLSNLASGIKDKLDQYGLRLARGVALTPEQQTRYDSLRSSFNDIQGYMTNQTAYDDYMTKLGDQTPEQYSAAQKASIENSISMSDFYRRGGRVK